MHFLGILVGLFIELRLDERDRRRGSSRPDAPKGKSGRAESGRLALAGPVRQIDRRLSGQRDRVPSQFAGAGDGNGQDEFFDQFVPRKSDRAEKHTGQMLSYFRAADRTLITFLGTFLRIRGGSM